MTPDVEALVERLRNVMKERGPVERHMITLNEVLAAIETLAERGTRVEVAQADPMPLAWLHKEHCTAYVITDRVLKIWLASDPKYVENYTIPLYGEPK